MKKCFLPLVLIAAVLALGVFPAPSAASADVPTLRVCNCEEYAEETLFSNVYGGETDSGEKNFVTWYKDTYGKDVKIEYSTKGSPEDMYNDVRIAATAGNKTPYDLICPSDYMIQKMLREDMLEPFDHTKIPNYETYASDYIKDIYRGVKSTNANGEHSIYDYAAGYMWGTMGIFYNVDNVSESDMQSWNALFNILYDNKITIKDSVRDTYFLGLAVVYRDELNGWADRFAAGGCTLQEYQDALFEICNRTDDKSLSAVADVLTKQKDILFGFELDNGKHDMASGKISINFAWSGDAACYINEGIEDGSATFGYAVPKEGSNVWFDGWVMPKGANTELAHAFVNYMSQPSIAKAHMDSVGYTSSIAGEEILDYVRESYMVEDGDITVDLSYFFGDTPNAVFTVDEQSYRPLYAQYADESTLNRCVMMTDFGDRNTALNDMWEHVKGGSFPLTTLLWVLGGIVVAAGIALVVILLLKKRGPRGATVVKRG